MNIVSDFKFQLDKYKIIKVVESYCQTPPYEELSIMYDNLIPLLKEDSKPLALYKLDEKPRNLNIDKLKDCNYVVYCIMTIGSTLTDKVNDLFESGKFFEAILLDTMSSFHLFDISSQLFNRICEKSHRIGLGLTCKIAPGDGDIDLEYQKEIIDRFSDENLNGIRIINNSTIYPSKSMSYIYGADKNIAFNQKDHCCENCHNTTCNIRNILKEEKEPFFNKIDCA